MGVLGWVWKDGFVEICRCGGTNSLEYSCHVVLRGSYESVGMVGKFDVVAAISTFKKGSSRNLF